MARCFCIVLLGTTLPCIAAPRARASDFQIVESVPQGSLYGEPGIPHTQAVWLDMVRRAKTRIQIAAFYVADKPGEALTPVLDALLDRARAGVRVDILLDASFLPQSRSSIERLRDISNLEIRILPMTRLTGGVLHAKYMIVDDLRVFVGSQNWDWRALDQIHEIGAEVTDRRFARTFAAAFDLDWRIAAGQSLPQAMQAAASPMDFAPVTVDDPVVLDRGGADPLVVFPAFSPPGMSPVALTQEQPALVRLIRHARRRLRIQVMTLSAIERHGATGYWHEIDGALRDAAARGVAVHIIVADWALDEPMQAYLKSLAVLPGIVVKFSVVPPAKAGFIPYARVEHCKYAVADDDSLYIGTGNWEWSYFNNTVDASVFVHGSAPATVLLRIFERDWGGSTVTRIDPGIRYAPPRTH